MDEHPAAGERATRGEQLGSAQRWEAESTSSRVVRRRRPLRVVVGVVLVVAIGLLWPFAHWSWWPMVIGLVVLVGLYLSRLDRLLRGWAPHLAGLVTLTLLLARTGPWVWGFAAGLALLGYGLVRLPDRRVLAVGVALTAVFGIGYGVSQYRTGEEHAAEQARTNAEQAANVMATSAELVLPSIANSVASGDARTACALLGSPAGRQFAEAHAAPDCAAAVTALAAQVTDPGAYRSVTLPPGAIVRRPDGATVDGCRARWPGTSSSGATGSAASSTGSGATASGAPPGPPLGRFELRRYQADRFLIVGYAPCR